MVIPASRVEEWIVLPIREKGNEKNKKNKHTRTGVRAKLEKFVRIAARCSVGKLADRRRYPDSLFFSSVRQSGPRSPPLSHFIIKKINKNKNKFFLNTKIIKMKISSHFVHPLLTFVDAADHSLSSSLSFNI